MSFASSQGEGDEGFEIRKIFSEKERKEEVGGNPLVAKSATNGATGRSALELRGTIYEERP
jgi:hypothetical protein